MSNGPVARYAFLPWSRQGIAALLDNQDPLDDSLLANLTLPVHLDVNQASAADIDLRLFGPGDVIGFDPRQVSRTEPRDQTKDYLPNYLPAVEFPRPDLPWVFTPAAAGQGDRLRPWICLVVVERRAGVALDFTRQMVLPQLTVADPEAELPPLEESWAWAHVQISGDLAGTSLEELVASEPHKVSSRLICPRRLLPNHDYLACVVPAFDAGVKAGLGLPRDAANLAPAWSSGSIPDPITLPVYYHWEFSTGAAGDFEALAKLLEPRRAPATVGIRPMDITRPGSGMPDLPDDAPGRTLGLEGALQATDTERTPWPGETREPFQAQLRQILDAPHVAEPTEEPGPLIAPPSYGRWHAAQTTIPDEEPHWFRQLNLDPRERTVAGFGTLVVQDQQESLMHAAWEQAEDVLEANRMLIRAQLARQVGQAILEGDLRSLTVDSFVQITSPMHSRLRMSPTTFHKQLSDSVVPTPVVSPAFRRIVRPRGPLARRADPAGQRSLLPLVRRLNAREVAAAEPRRIPEGSITPGDPAGALEPAGLTDALRALLPYAFPAFVALFAVALVVLAAGVVLWATGTVGASVGAAWVGTAIVAATAAAAGAIWARANRDRWSTANTLRSAAFTREQIQAVPARPGFRLLRQGELPSDPVAVAASAPGSDSSDAALFRDAASELQATIGNAADLSVVAEAPELPLQAVHATMLDRLDPARTVKALMDERIRVSDGLWEPGPRIGDDLEPIMAYPVFDRPMYEGLRDISQDLLVPGLQDITPNTVTLLETNPRFIEAYMVGLNHEMGRELLWREFWTDQRGSYFRQFWDARGRVPAPRTEQQRAAARDIPEIHRWRSERDLGENMAGGSVEGTLVVLVRGELLRRFPTAMVYLAKAKFKPGAGGHPSRDRDVTTEEKHPLFRGTLSPDITFVGFNIDDDEARGDPDPDEGRPGWFVVFQEQPTDPRFGLDVAVNFAEDLDPLESWSHLSWGHLAEDQQAFDQLTHIRLAADLPKISEGIAPSTVAWGGNSAQMAFITLQQPVRIAIHADDMLPPVRDADA